MAKPLIEFARRKPLLIGGGVLGLAVVLGLGAFALGGGASDEGGDGPALGIAVVAPREPEIQAGERMGVGQLVNDFDAAALAQASLAQASVAPPPEDFSSDGVQNGWVGDERLDYPPKPSDYQGDPEPRRGGEWRTIDKPGDRRGLGFDGPRPETGAEREARRGPPAERPYRSRPSGDPNAAFY